MKRFYYTDANNKPCSRPVLFEELKALAAAGIVHSNTNIFPEDIKTWVKWSVVLEREEPSPPPAAPAPAPAPVVAAPAPTYAPMPAVQPAPVYTPPVAVYQAPATAPAPTATTAYAPTPVASPAPGSSQQFAQPYSAQAPAPVPTQSLAPTPSLSGAPAPAQAVPSQVYASAPASVLPSQALSAPAPLTQVQARRVESAPLTYGAAPVLQPEPEQVIYLDEPAPIHEAEPASYAAASTVPASSPLEEPAPATARQSGYFDTPTASQESPQQEGRPELALDSERTSTSTSSTSGAATERAATRRTGPLMRRDSSADSASAIAARASKKREQAAAQIKGMNWGAFVWGLIMVILEMFWLPYTLISNSALTLSQWGQARTLPNKESEVPVLTFLLVVLKPCIHIIFTLGGLFVCAISPLYLFWASGFSGLISGTLFIPVILLLVYFYNLLIGLVFESMSLAIALLNSLKRIESKLDTNQAEQG